MKIINIILSATLFSLSALSAESSLPTCKIWKEFAAASNASLYINNNYGEPKNRANVKNVDLVFSLRNGLIGSEHKFEERIIALVEGYQRIGACSGLLVEVGYPIEILTNNSFFAREHKEELEKFIKFLDKK